MVTHIPLRTIEWPETLSTANSEMNTDEIAGAFEFIGKWVNDTGKSKGFWDADKDIDTSDGTKFCLIHSEISEAFEALRNGNPPSEKTPEFSEVEEELADAVIRILDWGAQYGYDIGAAVISKGLYNQGRPYLHGKKF